MDFIRIDKLIAGIRAHALAHYESGGWDIIVESWDDAQIEQELREASRPASDELIPWLPGSLPISMERAIEWMRVVCLEIREYQEERRAGCREW